MPLDVISVVGARPEFVQAMPVSRALRARHREALVHTGQHYDYLMSRAFFEELEIPEPDWNLGVGSGSHAAQTAAILTGFEQVLMQRRPHVVVVRGDTNSTLGCALAAVKLGIPVAHVEAGERSFVWDQPEEINRVAVDRLARLHLCVSEPARQHLAHEGLAQTAHVVGDVMLDALMAACETAAARSTVLSRLALTPQAYALLTLHRAGNTDVAARLEAIVAAINSVGEPVVFPVHPRTREALQRAGLSFGPHVLAIPPVGYLDMITLERHARLIATDSGGVQREAYYLGVPCLTLRDETEWTGTVEARWNRLVGADPGRILAAWTDFVPPSARPPIHGDGRAAGRIVEILERTFDAR